VSAAGSLVPTASLQSERAEEGLVTAKTSPQRGAQLGILPVSR
jgi:hypothetical protein